MINVKGQAFLPGKEKKEISLNNLPGFFTAASNS